ncbi:ATP-binding protein [Rickettsiella massiliensis]|uniref:ATP-binding protein n=1 Tax=Rickettsiella massiliensis TaxID=676517 RepID=UPI0022871266|nr:ATP-binding protein [Rickettsiella massiliensis]
MIATIPGSLYWKDREGVYLGCNDYVAKIAGVSSVKEVIGKTDFDFSWKDEAPTILQTEREIMESEVPKELEISGRLSDGKKATFLVVKAPLYNANKEVIGILATSLDITERKKAEEDLRLEKEKAEAANEAKTAFLENMRHDIRTPLSGIVGCAHLIQMQADIPKKVNGFVDDLVLSSDALLGFLNNILESIKVAKGEIPILEKKFNLKEPLEQSINLNKSKAVVKNLGLSLDYDKKIPTYLRGDAFRVQRVIVELLTNALKYTDKGEIKVSARLKKDEEQTVMIELRVSDTGMGIPQDKYQEVYDRFTLLIPSYQGTHEGQGLGLWVVKQFIKDLNGEIHIESEVGKGTTFICLIPFRKSLLDETKVEDSKELVELKETHNLPKKRVMNESSAYEVANVNGSHILVVEDNPIAVTVAKNVLSEFDCQMDIAPDGKTALEKVEKKLL